MPDNSSGGCSYPITMGYSVNPVQMPMAVLPGMGPQGQAPIQQFTGNAALAERSAVRELAGRVDSQGKALNQVVDAVKELAGVIARAFPYLNGGGQMGTYDANAGTGNAARLKGSLYKGGVLTSGVVNIADNAPAGTTGVAGFGADEQARMTMTTVCRVLFFINPGAGGGGQLETQAGQANVTLLLNGSEVPEFRAVPLIRVINTLDGDERAAPISLWVPADGILSFRITTTALLNGNPGESSDVFMVVDSATECY